MRSTPTAKPAPSTRRSRRLLRRDDLTGLAFVAPFLLAYVTFLVIPFGRAISTSFLDWNLLAVVFNPDAKQFVGLENWRDVLWGTGITWSATIRPIPRLLGIALAAWLALRTLRGTLRPRSSLPAILALLLATLLLAGLTPGEGGAWNDRRFYTIVTNTLTFVGLTVPSITLLALLLASALNQAGTWAAALRTAFFVSQVLSVTVVTLIWQLMYSPAQGILANVARSLGLEPITWVTNPDLAMPAIVITTVWWSLGFAMVLFLAGLQDIPAERYEAARLDGANALQTFRFITLPGIARTVTLVVVFEIVLHFQVFGQAHLITRGGPNDATQTLVRYIYQTAFRDGELGYAAALSIVLFALMLGFSLLQMRLEGRTD